MRNITTREDRIETIEKSLRVGDLHGDNRFSCTSSENALNIAEKKYCLPKMNYLQATGL